MLYLVQLSKAASSFVIVAVNGRANFADLAPRLKFKALSLAAIGESLISCLLFFAA